MFGYYTQNPHGSLPYAPSISSVKNIDWSLAKTGLFAPGLYGIYEGQLRGKALRTPSKQASFLRFRDQVEG